MTGVDVNELLRQVAVADDPAEPLRLIGIDLGDLTQGHTLLIGQKEPSSPYERLVERVMTSGFSGPEAAFDGLMALEYFFAELLGPHQSLVQLIGRQWSHRLLIAVMLTLRLMEPDPEAIWLQEELLVR